MVLRRILGSSKLFPFKEHTGDVVVELKDYTDLGSAIIQEDIPMIGDYTDSLGNVTTKNKQSVMFAGVENINTKLDGGKDYDRTERGARSSTHLTRKKSIMLVDEEKE